MGDNNPTTPGFIGHMDYLEVQDLRIKLNGIVAYCKAPGRGLNVVGDIETDIGEHRYSTEYYLARIERLAEEALRILERDLQSKRGE